MPTAALNNPADDMDPRDDAGVMLKELHDDLGRKYSKHGATVEKAWRSFDQAKRARCMKGGAADGVVLRHRLDRSIGDAYSIVPEWNLRDISESGPDFLLDLLKHRATRSLFNHYCEGVNGGLGDHEFINEMMRTRNLRHANPVDECIVFLDDAETYARSYKIVGENGGVLAPLIRARVCLPQSIGGLIVMRQTCLLQSLNLIIEDILEEGSQTRIREERPERSGKAVAAALSKLHIQPLPSELTLADLIISAQDRKDSLEEYLGLLSAEPIVLAHAVNVWFFSRPELVHDERGRSLPVHTDRYISTAFFDAIHSAVRRAATWDYIDRLLGLLESSAKDKVYRAVVLQEISNVCHLEYGYAQALFKRHIQTGTGSKNFRRIYNVYDKAGNARVTMKGKPEDLTRTDPQLHYLLRLCQTEINASNAVDWIKKLSNLQGSYPLEREKLRGREAEALDDLVVVTAFIQDLSSVVSIPSLSRKKGQTFAFRSQELEAELNQFKEQIDLRDFAAPIDNLLEPGMAEGALKTLDQFLVERVGTGLGFLYHDLVEDCLSDVQEQYRHAKARVEQKDRTEWVSTSAVSSEPPEKRMETRKQKEKTRPPHSSVYDITRDTELDIAGEPCQPAQIFKVTASTAQVFSTLFDKSEHRGSINWGAFEAAMADVGFSVVPKFGAVYTFLPPESMAVRRPITLHRPHGPRIEGYRILFFARRLERRYGWGKGTFEVA